MLLEDDALVVPDFARLMTLLMKQLDVNPHIDYVKMYHPNQLRKIPSIPMVCHCLPPIFLIHLASLYFTGGRHDGYYLLCLPTCDFSTGVGGLVACYCHSYVRNSSLVRISGRFSPFVNGEQLLGLALERMSEFGRSSYRRTIPFAVYV